MRRSTFAAVALLLAAGAVQAQSPFAMELRGGAAVPTADLDDTALKTGGGFEFTGRYRIMPHVLAYVGWDWFRFVTDEPFAGADFDVENTGYAFGLQFQHPLAGSMEWLLRAGAVYNHIELEDNDGDIVADSGHEFGWEVGGGVSIPLNPRFALTPGVRYRTLSADLDVGAGNVPVDLSYVAIELGIAYSFGARPMAAAMR
jgi:opacity protein-like surface antigen